MRGEGCYPRLEENEWLGPPGSLEHGCRSGEFGKLHGLHSRTGVVTRPYTHSRPGDIPAENRSSPQKLGCLPGVMAKERTMRLRLSKQLNRALDEGAGSAK